MSDFVYLNKKLCHQAERRYTITLRQQRSALLLIVSLLQHFCNSIEENTSF